MDLFFAVAGRLHPLLVHFPIALLLVGAAIRLYGIVTKRQDISGAARLFILVGAVSAVVASLAGLALAYSGEFHGAAQERLQLHRVLALLATTGAVAAAVLERRLLDVNRFGAHVAPLFLTAIVVAVAAHFGGMLAFGEDHFSSAFTATRDAAAEARMKRTRALTLHSSSVRAVDYRTEVLPLLERSCFRCHGEKKQKGGLRLDTRAAALQGGDSGPGIVAGDPLASLVYRAITLEETDDDFMPAKGEALTLAERLLIGRWIEHGADYAEDPTAAGAWEE